MQNEIQNQLFTISIPVEPPTATAQGKRAVKTKDGIRFFKSTKSQSALTVIRTHIRKAWGERPTIKESLTVEIDLIFPLYAKDKAAITWHDGKPDIDNAVKDIIDQIAAAGVVTDDKQIVALAARKVRAVMPAINIRIYRANDTALFDLMDADAINVW